MSKSIHWTYKIFKHRSKREIIEMCNSDKPDYAVEELCKKTKIKQEIKEKRAESKLKRNFE